MLEFPERDKAMRHVKAVRNPLTRLPAARQALDLPAEPKAVLRAPLSELSRDVRTRAELAWKRRKAPMAAYWKAVAVYARHGARLLK